MRVLLALLVVGIAECGPSIRPTYTLEGHSRRVSSVSFSPDGKRIVSGSFDKTVKVWDAQTSQETLTLKGHSDLVRSVSFSPDGKLIASASGSGEFEKSGEIKVWDAHTGKERFTRKEHSGTVTSVSFRPDGKRIVSGGGGETVKIWDISSLATSK
jgi:WD40 repeat protein